MNEVEKHHPWCTWFMNPRENCGMCDRLFEAYPIEVSVNDMVKKHFPGAELTKQTTD
jgi:hypothetical protein